MNLKPKDITNLTLLQEKYREFKLAAEAITQEYFMECIVQGLDASPDPEEKERLEHCSRILDDLHIPLGAIARTLNHK